MVRAWCWGVMALGTLCVGGGSVAASRNVRPAGSPGDWITPDDYPPQALIVGATGASAFRLDVDPSGHVSKCTITSGSGALLLDQTTCRLLSARAQFVPALDRRGKAIAATYSSSVRWQIPDGGHDESVIQARFESCRPDGRDIIQIETAFGCTH